MNGRDFMPRIDVGNRLPDHRIEYMPYFSRSAPGIMVVFNYWMKVAVAKSVSWRCHQTATDATPNGLSCLLFRKKAILLDISGQTLRE
jgi:hypothetical protein